MVHGDVLVTVRELCSISNARSRVLCAVLSCDLRNRVRSVQFVRRDDPPSRVARLFPALPFAARAV